MRAPRPGLGRKPERREARAEVRHQGRERLDLAGEPCPEHAWAAGGRKGAGAAHREREGARGRGRRVDRGLHRGRQRLVHRPEELEREMEVRGLDPSDVA